MRFLRIPVVVAVLSLMAAAPARAETWSVLKDTSTHDSRPQTLDVDLILGLFFGYTHFGVAGWYGYPIVPNGFIPQINDALYIEAGAAAERYSDSWAGCSVSWYRITPMGGARYQVYLTQDWTVFATLKAGFGLGFGESWDCGGYTGSGANTIDRSAFKVDGGVGAYWNFSENWRLRLELGYFGFTPGIGTDLMK